MSPNSEDHVRTITTNHTVWIEFQIIELGPQVRLNLCVEPVAQLINFSKDFRKSLGDQERVSKATTTRLRHQPKRCACSLRYCVDCIVYLPMRRGSFNDEPFPTSRTALGSGGNAPIRRHSFRSIGRSTGVRCGR